MVAQVVPGAADADWVFRHLGSLAGLAGGGAPFGGDRRGEAFAAWRYFFEALTESRPLVLVFEDLHWADEGLLDFVDYLVDWAGGVPLLVVGLTRPELLERRPGWGGGKPNALTLSPAPLSDQDTARLIGSLLGRPVLEAGQQAALLARAGGNPLYAEQYVQMLAERGAGQELPVPDSVQAIIGARLDLLPPADKRLLQDAAVVGKVFWPGAVAALGGPADRRELEECLHALERKQFVRRERRSSVAGETEYAFAHTLVRDVAYGQIPRAVRAGQHLHAAGWIESLGRPDDMLADEFDTQIAQEALDLEEQLGLEEVRAHVLITAGTGRAIAGDPQGKADLQRGLEIALAGNFLVAAVRGYANLSTAQRVDGDLREAFRLALEAEKVAQRFGTKAAVRWTRGVLIGLWFELGDWDKCAPAADEFLAESAAAGPHYQDTGIWCCRSWIRLARGDTEAALQDQRESLLSGRQAKDPQALYPSLSGSAYVLALAGRADEAQPILSELFGSSAVDRGSLDETSLECVLAAEILGRRDEARRWLSARRDSPWHAAARKLADQEFAAAAESLDSMGAARAAALARLRAAQELTRAGRRAEADDQLRQALSFFRSVGATRFVREAEALRAASA